MTAEAVDIDLYAEDIEQDFNPEEGEGEFTGEAIDLYDDAITTSSSVKQDSENGDPEAEPGSSASASTVQNRSSGVSSSGDSKEGTPALRKHQAYVGNLTWWTSDQDIQDCVRDVGVEDFVEVKFFENRANGQSKGFCVLTVGSEASLRIIHDKMSKKEIHGQLLVVTPPTKQALNQFESQSKTRPTPPPQGNQGSMSMMGPRPPPMGPMRPPMGGMGMGFGPRMMMGPMRVGPRGPPMGGPPPHRNMNPNQVPLGNYNPPNRPPMGSQSGSPQRGPPSGMHLMHGPHGAHGPMPPRGPMHDPMMDTRGPPPRDWNRPPMNPYPPPHGQAGLSPAGPGGPMQGPPHRGGPPHMQMGGAAPPGPPAPHVNPAFFNPSGPPQGGGGPPSGFVGSSRDNSRSQSANNYHPPIERREIPAIKGEEFEEVMSRNRTVSSSAISRAVTDAAAGEFASAIETLVTAISLIKQSKVAADERCKIIVSSLHDTLHGIETQSYGGRRERSRSRERDRNRRGSRRDRSRSRGRDRSRSREREYRNRSRERHDYFPRDRSRSPRPREYREGRESRYYDDRDRYRERDARERDRERARSDGEKNREREREATERSEMHRGGRH